MNGQRDERWLILLGWQDQLKEEVFTMGNGPYFGSGRSSDCPQMSKVQTQQGTAKPEPGQGTRTPNSGAGGEASLEGRGTMEQK